MEQQAAGPKFSVTFEGEPQGEYTLDELVETNLEGAPEFCEWMRTAKVGESHLEGGGAAPNVVTVRVA
jgi:hypothetical protein